MEVYNKQKKQCDLEIFNELVSVIYNDYRLSVLAQKIKSQAYRPKIKFLSL